MQGTWVWSLIQEDSTCCRQLSLCTTAAEACAPQPVLCNKRSHHNEKPGHRNLSVASTHLNWRKPSCSNAAQPKINKKKKGRNRESSALEGERKLVSKPVGWVCGLACLWILIKVHCISSVQFSRSVVSDPLQPHGHVASWWLCLVRLLLMGIRGGLVFTLEGNAVMNIFFFFNNL